MKDLLEQYKTLEAERAERIAAATADLAPREEELSHRAYRELVAQMKNRYDLVSLHYDSRWAPEWDALLLADDDGDSLHDEYNDCYNDAIWEAARYEAQELAGPLWDYLDESTRTDIVGEISALNYSDPMRELAANAGPLWVTVYRGDWGIDVPLDREMLFDFQYGAKGDRIWVSGRLIGEKDWDKYDHLDVSIVLTRQALSCLGRSDGWHNMDEESTIDVRVEVISETDEALAVEAYLTGEYARPVEMAVAS